VHVLEIVRKEIENRHLLDVGDVAVVGVSGGSDSLCLLHVLTRLRRELDLSLHVAHLNHCLRGDEADADMTFVALLATEWGLPCTIEVRDVAAVAASQHISIEEAARHVRYGFLMNVANRVGAAVVAVGHHADDQSETVLMHILRGTGISGLKGMLPSTELSDMQVVDDGWPDPGSRSRVRLVRPLLAVPRDEIDAYCRDHGLQPRFDRSNLDTTHFRNRVRHELLPLLETYNPNIKLLLQRTADVAAADNELISSLLNDAWSETVTEENKDRITFDLQAWRSLPLGLQRATLREAAHRYRPRIRDLDFVHVKHAVAVGNNGTTGARAVLPHGLVLSVGYDTLQLGDREQAPRTPDWPLLWCDDPVPVKVGGDTFLPRKRQTPATSTGGDEQAGWVMGTRAWRGDHTKALNNPDRWTAFFDADRLGSQLSLRRRLPGDRFQPLGMGGRSVSVSDFMINVKVPQHLRATIPLLVRGPVDGASKADIAWVVGWRIDEQVSITAKTRRIVRLRWHHSTTREMLNDWRCDVEDTDNDTESKSLD
jgi:tRNA(Ile)-lysidine synthase